MGMIKFNGASSKDFGVEVETFPNYVAPQKEYEAIHIPGRNGDLLIDSGTYSNVEKRYKVNMVKEPPATEVSGPIANFKSNISLPLSELKVNIDPVQDLHGYSKPWSGGGGKNLFNDTTGTHTINANTDATLVIGDVYLEANTTYTISCKQTPAPLTSFVHNTLFVVGGGSSTYNPAGNDYTIKPMVFTPTVSGTYSVRLWGHTLSANTTYSEFQVEKGSTATAYEPYSNICPISGFSALNVTRTGKNLLNNSDITTTQAAYVINNVNVSLIDGYYMLSFDFSGTSSSSSLRIDDENGTAIFTTSKTITSGHNEFLINLPSKASYVKLFSNAVGAYSKFQIERGNQFTTYEPYNGQTAIVNFGQTVYGGVADVTNGKVTVTKIAHVFDGSENFLTLASGRVFAYDFGVNLVGSFNNNNSLCSHFHEGYGAWDQLGIGEYLIAGGRYGGVNPDMTLADYKTYLQAQYSNGTPVTIVATLATPIEISTTPENLTAISGENNIFSDSGDVTIKTNELATTYSGKMELIANWLNSASGYARLEDSYDPDYYRLAYFNQALDIDNLYDEAGQVTLSFICKPQKFYKSGEESVVFTSAGRIQNRTQHTALPLLKVKTDNTDGTVSIGNSSFGISAGSGTDIIIDCELQNAYYGIENKNNYIVLNDGDFPRIEPGTQVVSFTGGVQSVEVIPRWWTV